MATAPVAKEMEQITYKIIGAAMAVHRRLGPGHEEKVYQKALEAQFTQEAVDHEPQKKIFVQDNGVVLGFYKIDFVVSQKVVVEIKALQAFSNEHIAQVVTYLVATGLNVGLLLNFGQRSLKVKRMLPPKNVIEHRANRRWLHVREQSA